MLCWNGKDCIPSSFIPLSKGKKQKASSRASTRLSSCHNSIPVVSHCLYLPTHILLKFHFHLLAEYLNSLTTSLLGSQGLVVLKCATLAPRLRSFRFARLRLFALSSRAVHRRAAMYNTHSLCGRPTAREESTGELLLLYITVFLFLLMVMSLENSFMSDCFLSLGLAGYTLLMFLAISLRARCLRF